MDKRKRRLLCMLEGSGWKSRWISGVPPLSFKALAAGELENYRIYGNTVGGESVGDLVTSGEHAGEYKVPVTVSNGNDTLTTPIYLPEQIRKIGDEAEYIDYAEQKQHRVRVNLFEGVIVNGSFSSTSGDLVTAGNRIRMDGDTFIYLVPGTYTINASGVDDVVYYSYSEADVSTYARSGSQVNWLSLPCTFEVTNAFYFLFGFRFSDNSNISPSDISNIMLNSGSEPLPYEPYIENTDLDVTLPALPTLLGANVLSVGTAVQPSKIEVKGKIKDL